MLVTSRNLVGLAMVALLFAACENDMAEVNRLFSKEETKVEVAKGVEMVYSDSAVVKLRIVTSKMVRHLDKKDPYQEFPEGVTIEFFGEDGNVTGRLTAQYAERYENDNKFIVQDSVVWTGGRGERLETEELTWDEEKDRVFTNKFVVVRRPDEVIYGHGFESNQKFTQWSIKAIEGRIKAPALVKDFQG